MEKSNIGLRVQLVILVIVMVIAVALGINVFRGIHTDNSSEESSEPIRVENPDNADVDSDTYDLSGVYDSFQIALIDNVYGTVKFNNVHHDKNMGTVIVYDFTNKYDKDLKVKAINAYINEYQFGEMSLADAKPGESSKMYFTISDDELNSMKYDSIDKMEFDLVVQDNFYESLTGNEPETYYIEHLIMYPSGKNPETLDFSQRVQYDNEKVILDDEYATVIILDRYINDIKSTSTTLDVANRKSENHDYQEVDFSALIDKIDYNIYIENKTDKQLTLTFENITIGGQEVGDMFIGNIEPNSRRITCGYVNAKDYGKLTSEEIDPFKFTLRLRYTHSVLSEYIDLVDCEY